MSKLQRAIEMTAGSKRGAESVIKKLRGSVECDCGCTAESKKKTTVCKDCGGVFCLNHIYYHVDGNNRAICKSAPPLCMSCYQKQHGKRNGWTS